MACGNNTLTINWKSLAKVTFIICIGLHILSKFYQEVTLMKRLGVIRGRYRISGRGEGVLFAGHARYVFSLIVKFGDSPKGREP